MDAGVFVLGMHRSGTSAVTRLVSLLGLDTPPEEDLVQPTEKNPKGYWESESLVAFNERLLWAIDCDIDCPPRLAPGWEDDSRLDPFRGEARAVVREVFPVAPWVWKDPRHCLAFAFWRSALDVRPVVVLVNRNPLEITASALRVRSAQGRVYALALWERYLQEALRQVAGLPVLVTSYTNVLSAPLDWCRSTQEFLASAGVPVREAEADDVLAFVDSELRHAAFTLDDLRADPDVSVPQLELYAALEALDGPHESFSLPVLPEETPTTEALLTERRRTVELKRRLETEQRSSWSWRLRHSRYTAPARPLYARGRRLVQTLRREQAEPFR